LIEDPNELIPLVADLTNRFEANQPVPWIFDPAETFIHRMAKQIVGFRIAIDRIDGKWKLNQNHPVERRRRVIAALREQGGDDANEIADLMVKSIGE